MGPNRYPAPSARGLAAGRGSLATAGKPAVGRKPPGSRLHRRPRPVRGRAQTPRAHAHRLLVDPVSRGTQGGFATEVTGCRFGTTPIPGPFARGLAAGRGSLATAGKPAVGRKPPGSRLHRRPRPVRGRAETPRAHAHRLLVDPVSRGTQGGFATEVTGCRHGTKPIPGPFRSRTRCGSRLTGDRRQASRGA